MATYTVTTSNWNDAAFWNAISEAGPVHTLDLSNLPSSFDVDFWPDGDRIVISDGTSTFTIGDSDYGGGVDAQMGGSTQLEYFTTIRSSQGSDYSDGGANDDTISGNDGNDTLSGNGGDDSIEGNSGHDNLSGGSGDDTLRGGDSSDTLSGGSGNDHLYGDSGSDNLSGGGGNDTIEGGGGNDSIYGGYGDDSISGGSGNDLIQGEQGDDTIDGAAGADTINVSDHAGVDEIDGGSTSGDDTLVFVSSTPVVLTFTTLESGSYAYDGGGRASGTFLDIEHFEGGSGQDTLDFSGLPDAITVTYTGEGAGTITDGTQTISFNGIEKLVLTDQNDAVDASASWNGFTGDHVGENIDGGGGDDTITGGNGGDTLEGGSGNDVIDGDYGDDSLSGGAGDDTIIGGRGNDTIEGGDGADSLDGGVEADTLIGGAGDDTIDGGSDDDLQTGGSGNDVFVVSDGDDTITDFNSGNTGSPDDGDTTNNDFIDLSGHYDNLGELRADFDDDGILNQSNDLDEDGNATDYSDNTQFGSNSSVEMQGASRSSYTSDNTGVVCFTTGTAILTPQGEVLVDDLAVGDLVTTMDNGPQRIRWIGTTSLGAAELAANPRQRPVLIQRGVLGVERDLLVSPQHGMMIGPNHLARATHLAKTIQRIRIANGKKQVTYVHLMFDEHQVIFAENAPSESFYPGPMALKMMGTAARAEVFAMLPDLATALDSEAISRIYGPTARDFIKKRDVRGVLQVAATRTGFRADGKRSASKLLKRTVANGTAWANDFRAQTNEIVPGRYAMH